MRQSGDELPVTYPFYFGTQKKEEKWWGGAV
jgi:hypothetical protein